MSSAELITVHHVGNEQALSKKHTIRVVFHNFEKLPHDRDEYTESPVTLCHGYQWKLALFPGGDDESPKDTVHLSLYLDCVSADSNDCKVKAKSSFRIPSTNYSTGIHMYGHVYKSGANVLGCEDFLRRSRVLERYLVGGNLTVEVDIQVYMETLPIFRPEITLNTQMMKLLESSKHSDIKFQVGTEEFPAHRLVLAVRAPILGEAALVEGCLLDTPIPIQGVESSIFRLFLSYVYADEVPESEDFLKVARQLLDVADRFGCISLKLLAEAELVQSGITVDTAADLIIFADAKNCALLKEAAMEFFAVNPAVVMSSPGWGKVEESLPLMKELMAVLASNKKRPAPVDDSDEETDYKRMRVSTLRGKLEEKGIDVDGSREMLISRIEQGDADSSGNSSNEDN
jgi:speckle-type POZ protein